jgi:Fur family ferric uptake transcriptional regulator
MIGVMRHPHGHAHEAPAGPAELRSRGRRLTRQRRLIWDALVAEADAHLSADDVVERVGGVDPSTVYRTLELLVEEGLVRRTDLGAGRAFYEPAHEHRHHHLVCERCGSVTHVHDDALGNLREQVDASVGFALGGGEIKLTGLCADCR